MANAFWYRALRGPAIAASVSVSAVALAPAAHAEKYAAIVVDADTGEVLHARHQDDPRYPASLTKVMTLYLLFDAVDAGEVKLTDKMTVSRNAAAQPPSNLRLRAGDKISVEDAIYALVTKSANDVAVVVAEHLGGTESKFATQMTRKGRDLGLTNTTFRNASGLPNTAQLSTARDLAILADALLDNHGKYYHYFQNQRFSWGGMTYRNHNELINTVEGVDGIKTGYTRASGFNLMTSAERDGRRIIAIMMGGASAKSRNTHVAELVETAFTAIGLPPEVVDPDQRLMTFAALQQPLNPNAAAEPMLNGKPLSVILAENHAASAIQPEPEIVEGDAGEQISAREPDVVSNIPAPAADYTVLDTLSFTLADLPHDIAEHALAAETVPEEVLPAAPVFDGISVAEYEARQRARAAASAQVSDYTRRQLRRR